MKYCSFAAALCLIASTCLSQPSTQPSTVPAETSAQRDARMKWWREARFGMFIHWGIYSVPAGTYQDKQIGGIGEWIMNNADIPVAEYAKYAEQFNPTKFNADEFVAAAKNAGMKYIVITSKHHDGFAMFHSKASQFNIVDATPFKRDVIKELSYACDKQGIKFGVYYSQYQDWHHPGGGAYKRGDRPEDHWDNAQDGSLDDYINTIAIPQVTELLTNYPNLSVLWWDTPGKTTAEQSARLHDLLKLNPHLITNNRLGNGFKGDTETPEQRIPANGYPAGRDWETCMTMNDTWGYKSYDQKYKSAQTLIRNLIDIASKGGNYLLNVGPTAEGEIPAPQMERLKQIGEWLKVNGEAIYGTSAGPFKVKQAWGRGTQKGDRLYLHVFEWPKDGKLTVPIILKGMKAHLLADPDHAVDATSYAGGLHLLLPAAAPDPIATVIVVDHQGEIELLPGATTLPSTQPAK